MSEHRDGKGGRIGRGGNSRPSAQAQRHWADHDGRGVRPVWFIVIMDVFLLGVALNLFALSDNALRPEASVKKLPVKSSAAKASLTPAPTVSPTVTTQGVNSTVSPTPQATEDPNQGMWGAKFQDKFTGGDIQKTDASYKSHDVNVSISKHEDNGVVYFVADIFIRNLENFKAAFAKDKFGPIEKIDGQASDRNAILAINGDNAANRQNRLGYEVRNGDEYHAVPYQDVFVMYQDGSMKAFSRDDFNYEDEKNNGLWQVWSFGPMLLDNNGGPMTQFAPESITGANNPRTAIGYYEPGHYCFVVVDGRQEGYSYPGMSLTDLSKLMSSLGCKAAYNLDGGQSSIMVFNGSYVNHPYNGGRSTSDILYICETK